MPMPARGLNAQLILLVSCILLGTGAMSGWLTASRQTDMLNASMRRTADIVTRNLGDRCAYYLVLQDFAGLESFLMRSVGDADLLRLQVCEPNGVVVGDIGTGPAGTIRRQPGPASIEPPGAIEAVMTAEKEALVVWQPVEAGSHLGWLRAVYSMAAIRKMERETWRYNVLLSFLWVAGSTALLLSVLRPFVSDIGRLAGFARGLGAHKGEQMAVRQRTAELEELGASLNYASARIFATEQELIREKETLKEQHSTLRGIIDSADALIFSVDREYRYTSFNAGHAAVMAGIYGTDIQPGMNLLEAMTVAADREKAQRNLDRALAGEHFVESAYSGEEARARLYFEVSHNPIRAGDGTIIGVAVLSHDITERKRAEEELRRINRELRALSECNEALLRAKDEDLLLADICRIICDEAGYRMAWVGYAENDVARTVRPMSWAGFEDGYLAHAAITWSDTERGRGPTGRAIRNGESVCIQDFAVDDAAAPWRESALKRGYRSSIALPLRDERDHVFGAFMIYSGEPNAFTKDEVRLLGELASDLAFGIVVLRGRIERKAAAESLRALNEQLEQRVRERTAELEKKNEELERMNRLFVGRELRMRELKDRIEELEKARDKA